ncbi:thioredoxin-like protein [Mycena crocata]|nr:thioredoxin-like protein [Mycena crocata]
MVPIFPNLSSSSFAKSASQSPMFLKLYAGKYVFGGAAIVAMVLSVKQIPFEHVLVDMPAREHKTPQFLAKHPFRQTPAIDDDGFIVYESRAICRYFAGKYAGREATLHPTCLEEKTRFEQAASVEFANFNPILKVIKEVVINPFFAVPANAAVVVEALSDLSATLEVYDCILSRQKYLAGNELTLADIFHLAYAPSLADALF